MRTRTGSSTKLSRPVSSSPLRTRKRPRSRRSTARGTSPTGWSSWPIAIDSDKARVGGTSMVNLMQLLGVHSEVGTLRTVLVCRPSLAHQRLTPRNRADFLFDDVLWVHEAQRDPLRLCLE